MVLDSCGLRCRSACVVRRNSGGAAIGKNRTVLSVAHKFNSSTSPSSAGLTPANAAAMSASASANPLAERLRAASSLLSQAVSGRASDVAADSAADAAVADSDITSTVVAVPLALLQSVLSQLESCIAQADSSFVPSGEWAEKMKMQLRQKGAWLAPSSCACVKANVISRPTD